MQTRIDELILELNECREDERNTQNQILQIISVVGTILGILLGTSYLNPDLKGKSVIIFPDAGASEKSWVNGVYELVNSHITYARVIFWLSLLLFITAFAYIILLGINNILRYYYIQNLEDRLYVLSSKQSQDDEGRGALLHWNAYIAPIITRDIRHVASSHTALYHVFYTIATFGAVVFSMGMVMLLYLEIEPREWFDQLIIRVALVAMLLAFVLFMRTSVKAKDVAQFAWDMAHENQKIRLKEIAGTLYGKNASFMRFMKYLIYPKLQDLQKPALMIVGFLCGMMLMDFKLAAESIKGFAVVFVVFDILAYQARYLINDIRGIEEDIEAGCRNRLLSDDINPGHAIKIAAVVAGLRIIAALGLTAVLGGKNKALLLAGLAILFVSSVLYENAKDRKKTTDIFILVGMGYPLRFFVGFFAAVPMSPKWLNGQMLCVILAIWSYGSFSAIMAWANEVTNRMQIARENTGSFPASYRKKHFEVIQNLLGIRFLTAKANPVMGKVMPLREKGTMKDPWNPALILSLALLALTVFFHGIPRALLGMEFGACVIFVSNIYLKRKKKVAVIVVGWIFIVGKMLAGIIYYRLSVWYFLLSAMQMLITITYFVLCYQPQLKKFDVKKVVHWTGVKILGEYAIRIMESHGKRDRSE